MRNIRCPGCGNDVRLLGVGAICPHCGELLFADDAPPKVPVEPAPEPLQLKPSPTDAPMRVESIPIEDEIPFAEPDPAPPPADAIEELGAIVEKHAPPAVARPRRDEAEETAMIPVHYLVIGLLLGALVVLGATLLIFAGLRAREAPTIVVLPPTTLPPPAIQRPPPATRPAPVIATSAPAPIPPADVAWAALPEGAPHRELAFLRARRPRAKAEDITDQEIGAAITRGVKYLMSQFLGSQLRGADSSDVEAFQGLNALAIYAVLHCGLANRDPISSAEDQTIKAVLDRLKEFPMDGNKATYSRSLRISALTVLNRQTDRSTVEADLRWLLKASLSGAYTYAMPAEGAKREHLGWDNSNSQYGALGVWAASEAGFHVPIIYWQEMERHWIAAQTQSGGWGYGARAQNGILSMTAAGTTMLFVARDRLMSESQNQSNAPLSKPILAALSWLEEGDNAITIGAHPGYTLYGLERAGLASGYKYFGEHDWYSELAAVTLARQAEDGSWSGSDGAIAETSFALLFLARGRHPVILAKLDFNGAWNNRPRDVSAFTRFASRQLERPLNWEVANIRHSWWSWADAPVLLMTSDRAPSLRPSEIDKLRAFAEAGGLLLLNTEQQSAEFNAFAAELAKKLFPDHPFGPVPADHPVYSTVFNMTTRLKLNAVSNGVRLLMVHSPDDLTRQWQPSPPAAERAANELSVNLLIYAAGQRDLRNRLTSTFVAQPTDSPTGRIPLARLKYDGNWDPEPAGWPRMARVLQNQTGLGLFVLTTPVRDLNYSNAPIAHLTGMAALELGEADVDALRQFVLDGGLLLVDPCGGPGAFLDSVQNKLLPRLFPDKQLAVMPPDHLLLAGAMAGAADLRRPLLRPTLQPSDSLFRSLRAGAGEVIVCGIDMSSGLLGTNTVGINGFDPAYSQDLARNAILLTIRRIRDAGSAAATRPG